MISVGDFLKNVNEEMFLNSVIDSKNTFDFIKAIFSNLTEEDKNNISDELFVKTFINFQDYKMNVVLDKENIFFYNMTKKIKQEYFVKLIQYFAKRKIKFKINSAEVMGILLPEEKLKEYDSLKGLFDFQKYYSQNPYRIKFSVTFSDNFSLVSEIDSSQKINNIESFKEFLISSFKDNELVARFFYEDEKFNNINNFLEDVEYNDYVLKKYKNQRDTSEIIFKKVTNDDYDFEKISEEINSKIKCKDEKNSNKLVIYFDNHLWFQVDLKKEIVKVFLKNKFYYSLDKENLLEEKNNTNLSFYDRFYLSEKLEKSYIEFLVYNKRIEKIFKEKKDQDAFKNISTNIKKIILKLNDDELKNIGRIFFLTENILSITELRINKLKDRKEFLNKLNAFKENKKYPMPVEVIEMFLDEEECNLEESYKKYIDFTLKSKLSSTDNIESLNDKIKRATERKSEVNVTNGK